MFFPAIVFFSRSFPPTPSRRSLAAPVRRRDLGVSGCWACALAVALSPLALAEAPATPLPDAEAEELAGVSGLLVALRALDAF
jgi:hypothetical protein